MKKNNVIDYLWSFGQDLSRSIEKLIIEHGLTESLKLCGYAPWKILQFFDHPNGTSFGIKTLFIQKMLKRGILINSSLNINFSQKEIEKYKIFGAFNEVLLLIFNCLKNITLNDHLKGPVIKPLFKVR